MYTHHLNDLNQPNDVAAQPHAISPSSSSAQQDIITSPRDRDVLNGRGQGVQRHPGNVKYRKLVYVNKVRFIQCNMITNISSVGMVMYLFR